MATSFSTASYAVTAGAVTDGDASLLTAASGVACFPGTKCSFVCGTSVNETLLAGGGAPAMLGYIYTPTSLSQYQSPGSLKWVRCGALDWTPTMGAQFAASPTMEVPPGAMKLIHLPFQMSTSAGGSTFTVMEAAARSGT